MEAFTTKLMLAFWGGALLSMPFVLYQIWQFVVVGLKEKEKRYLILFIPLSILLFIFGCAFAYGVLLPAMLKFFLSFSTPQLRPMITVSQYISFLGTIVLSCGLIFELPLVVVFLTKIGVATPPFLIEKRRQAIIWILIISALLTPSPDCVSQILLAVPLVVLYEISILFSKLTFRLMARKANTGFDGSVVS